MPRNPERPAIPVLPLALGLGGLVPFWALAMARVSHASFGVAPATVDAALATYGATILAFLGGIRWGLAVASAPGGTPVGGGGATSNRPVPASLLVSSVVPQLAGWAALILPDPWRFAVLGLLHLGLGPLDRALVRDGAAPVWFGRLRALLALGAGAALFLAALA